MAKKDVRFTFLVDDQERHIIAAIAERLERTQSDSIRLLIRSAATELGITPTGAEQPSQGGERKARRG